MAPSVAVRVRLRFWRCALASRSARSASVAQAAQGRGAGLRRVRSRSTWVHCSAAARGLSSRAKPARFGFERSDGTPDVLIAAVSAALRSRAHSWRRSSWFAFRLKQSERTRDAKLACCCSRAARAAESAAASHRRYASGYSGRSGLLCSRAASRSAAARSCAREDILPRHDSSGHHRRDDKTRRGSSIPGMHISPDVTSMQQACVAPSNWSAT